MADLGKFDALDDWILIALFLAAIWVPLVRMKYGPAPIQSSENRVLAPFPDLSFNRKSLVAFPENFGKYFNDHFGFRSDLVRWQASAKTKYLHVSSSSFVIVGKEDWLFHDFRNDASIKTNQSNEPLTKAQLDRWRGELLARRDWLAQRGVRFLFVVAPEKQGIYPEYLPDNLPRRDGPSRLDQLIADSKENSGVEILDLRPFLLNAKETRQVYYKTDTHWNTLGAFVSYRAIMENVVKLFPKMKPLQESNLVSVKSRYSGDLTRMLGVYDLLSEEVVTFTVRDPLYVMRYGTPGSILVLFSDHQNPELPRLLVFGDSFGNMLAPFLSQHFGHAAYTNQNSFDPHRVETEKPNLVIEETVERYLFDEPPPSVPGTANN